VVTGHQQEPASSSLSFTGLTSSSIFQDDLGWAHILSFVCPYEPHQGEMMGDKV